MYEKHSWNEKIKSWRFLEIFSKFYNNCGKKLIDLIFIKLGLCISNVINNLLMYLILKCCSRLIYNNQKTKTAAYKKVLKLLFSKFTCLVFMKFEIHV